MARQPETGADDCKRAQITRPEERTIPHFALIVKEKGGTALAVVRQFILPGGLQIGHG